MTYAKTFLRKERMCRRFGHLPPRTTFRTERGVVAYYCPRCGLCCAAPGQPRALTTEGK
jgi:hypothetical protein